MREINNKYPKSKQLQFQNNVNELSFFIMKVIPISGALAFFTAANKSQKAGYKSENINKVVESPYDSFFKKINVMWNCYGVRIFKNLFI